MKSFIFWQRWLFYSSLLCALFGVVLAIHGDNLFFLPYNQAIAFLFWHQPDVPPGVEPFRSFVRGPLGGTIACAYILLAFIAYYPFKRKEKWARNAIMLAFGTWIILDSAVCMYHGVYFQVYLINFLSLLQKLLPIIFTWKDFDLPPKV
jgi:hypothetical protein